MHSSAKFIALFGLAACYVLQANAHSNTVGIEQKFATQFGTGKNIKWDLVSKMAVPQLAEMCSNVHALTGSGPAVMKNAKVVPVYLRFENDKTKPNIVRALRCVQNNKRQHTYYVTQGVDKNALTLIESEGKKAKGLEIFHFTWTLNEVRGIPTLLKLGA